MTEQAKLFPEPEYEYKPLFEESERQRQIRRAVELWTRHIPRELHGGDVVFRTGARTAKGHINGISCYGRIIVLELNPDPQTARKNPFLSVWDILPENILMKRRPGTDEWHEIKVVL